MKNIQISLTAKNYADALVKLGQDGILQFSEIFENLKNIQQITNSSKDLKIVISNPSISDDVKFSIIDEVFKNNIHSSINEFLKILIKKRRFSELDGIVEAFQSEMDKINNLQRVQVISAIDLTSEFRNKVIQALQQKLQKNIAADWQIDEDIIGGLIVKIGDDLIDTSLKKKLENLIKNIKGKLWH